MKNRLVDLLAYCSIALYTLAAILVSVHRFFQYEVFYYDFGIFDQAIWNVAHLRPPIVDHYVIGGKLIFADHFSPSMFLLTPIYWLTSRPEALLVAQALAVGLSGLVLYLIGKHVLKNRLLPLAITCSYLLFVGTQNAIIADVHEVTFMSLPLMLTFYGLVTKNKTLFWVSFFITLGFKESSALLGVGLAILIYFIDKRWLRTAIVVGVISVVWGILTTQIVIPYFYGQRYFYTPTLDYHPSALIGSFVNDPVKRETLWVSFLSFGFLPLLYPPAWPLIVQDIATRFMQKEFTLRWTLGLHYNIQMAAILSFSSIMGCLRLMKKKWHRFFVPGIATALIVLSLVLHRFILRSPLGLAYNPTFYRDSRHFGFLNDLIARVPSGTTVMTQNNLAPHMIHTHKVYLLRAVYTDFMPDYFVLDLREGQNINDFFGVDIHVLVATLRKDTRYLPVYETKEQVIFRRKS